MQSINTSTGHDFRRVSLTSCKKVMCAHCLPGRGRHDRIKCPEKMSSQSVSMQQHWWRSLSSTDHLKLAGALGYSLEDLHAFYQLDVPKRHCFVTFSWTSSHVVHSVRLCRHCLRRQTALSRCPGYLCFAKVPPARSRWWSKLSGPSRARLARLVGPSMKKLRAIFENAAC